MQIAVPREIKNREYRVALTPAGVRELTTAGHAVTVEAGAGEGAGFADARLCRCRCAHRARCRSVVRGCRTHRQGEGAAAGQECRRLSAGQTLFTYLHLAADRAQAESLMASGCTAIAYETITAADGSLPLLAPMSEIAGRMSISVAAHQSR